MLTAHSLYVAIGSEIIKINEVFNGIYLGVYLVFQCDAAIAGNLG